MEPIRSFPVNVRFAGLDLTPLFSHHFQMPTMWALLHLALVTMTITAVRASTAVAVCALYFTSALAAADNGIVSNGLGDVLKLRKFKMIGATSFSDQPLHTALMNSTFRLSGNVTGTVFLVGQPCAFDSKRGSFLLISAKHTFERMRGDTAALLIRIPVGSEKWVTYPMPLPIRSAGQPLWISHPRRDIDVAIMPVRLPIEAVSDLVSTERLADVGAFEQLAFRIGDEVGAIVYPLGVQSNPFGFGVYRVGRIASPVLLGLPSFVVSYRIFKGDSGGPVHATVRTAGGRELVVGLVINSIVLQTKTEDPLGGQTETVHHLDLATVLPSTFVLETIQIIQSKSDCRDRM